MRRIRTIIAYDGTDYVGWQTQNNGVAVQEKVEQAILEVTGQRSSLQGSGRTDSGVHARAQVAHFDADVFSRKYSLHAYMPLDLDLMNEAAALVVGTHDFSAFMSTGREVETAVRTVTLSRWEKQGKFLIYSVQGNGFLYNMVRILVGTMLGMGSGRLPRDSMERALLSLSRKDAGPTAPPHGLVLWRVKYPDFDTEEVLSRVP